MMIKCCGVQCKTAFCPHCGKSIVSKNPLESLLAHLEINVQRLAARKKSMTNGVDPHTLQMWTIWRDTIRDLLNKTTGSKPT